MEEPKEEMMGEEECKNHCYYKMGVTGKMILCARCGRIKVVKEADGEWKVLH